MLFEKRRRHHAHHNASLHVLGNRQAEQVTQGRSDVRRIDRLRPAPGINSFSEKNEEAIGQSLRRGVPIFSATEESLHSLEGPGRREAKRRNHRNQGLTVGGTEQLAELPVDELHHQLEE